MCGRLPSLWSNSFCPVDHSKIIAHTKHLLLTLHKPFRRTLWCLNPLTIRSFLAVLLYGMSHLIAERSMRPLALFLLTCSVVSVLNLTTMPYSAFAQSFTTKDSVIQQIWKEGIEHSQVYQLSQVMMDSIGPRLTGSPAMAGANDWAVAKYTECHI